MADTGYISPGTMANDATPLIDSYSESYNDGNTAEVYDTRRYGQTFQNGSAITLDSCKLSVRNYATTTGNCRVKVYAHTGTFGTSGVPTGAVLATSDDLDASTFSTSKVLITFSFTSANRITLSADTPYVIVIEMPTAADYQHGISIGEDRTSPVASGNLVYSFNSGSTWIADENIDAPFYVYGAVGTVTWSNPNNAKASDGSYSIAPAIGEFENPYDKVVKLVDATGSVVGDNNADLVNFWSTDADQTITYGGSNDLWGSSWSAENINDSDFGIVLQATATPDTEYLKATNFGFSIPTGVTIDGIEVSIERRGDFIGLDLAAKVDHIRIKVYYTTASSRRVFLIT